MPWIQIYEGKGWNTSLGETYDVSSIPFVLLVDGDTGEILATTKDLRGRGTFRIRRQAAGGEEGSGEKGCGQVAGVRAPRSDIKNPVKLLAKPGRVGTRGRRVIECQEIWTRLSFPRERLIPRRSWILGLAESESRVFRGGTTSSLKVNLPSPSCGNVADHRPAVLLLQKQQRAFRGVGSRELLVAVPLVDFQVKVLSFADSRRTSSRRPGWIARILRWSGC